MNNFEENLAHGQVGESMIANWLKWKRGALILPVYETEIKTGKGPRLSLPDGDLIAPDMLVIPPPPYQPRWWEAKHKTRWTWYRQGLCWQTGIDTRHYEDYLKVREACGYGLFLAFLHVQSKPHEDDLEQGSRSRCPIGLFVGEIKRLAGCVDHRSDEHANGMVYWRHGDLKRIATLKEVKAADREMREFSE